MRLGIGAPGAHLVRILACVLLDRSRSAAVGVAFAQHGIHGAAEHLAVTGLDFLLGIRLRIFRIVRDLVALRLQFLDRGLQLRDRCANIRQLDDVRFRFQRQFAQFGQLIRDLLGRSQIFREVREYASCKRDVSCLNGDAGSLGKGLNNRKQRVSCQSRRFIGQGVNNFLGRHVCSRSEDFVNGKNEMSRILLFNKPYGVICQFSRDGMHPTLADYIAVPDVYPAGRLDTDSEGLLLLTDDGKLQHRITDPKHKLAKTYWVQVEGVPDEGALQKLRRGVQLKDGMTLPAEARLMEEPADLWLRDPPVRFRKEIPTSWLQLTIREGRNRQVRRMTAAVGFPTLRLIRYEIGDWTLDGIAPGEFSQLNV